MLPDVFWAARALHWTSLGRMPSREWKVAEVIPNTRQMMMSLITRKSAKMVAELGNDTALWIPDTAGSRLEDYSAVAKTLHTNKALVVVAADPLSLVVLKPPSEFGTDAVVGWMQWFGAHIVNGCPTAVYVATSLKQVRRMPGRLIGESLDRLGSPVFRLNLQTQEQHIRDINKLLNDCDELIPKWLNLCQGCRRLGGSSSERLSGNSAAEQYLARDQDTPCDEVYGHAR